MATTTTEEKAAQAQERALAAAPEAVEKKTGEPVALNYVMADHEVPAPKMAPGMLRIRLHGGTYERDCTQKEWETNFATAKNIGKWDIVHTGIVAPGHSDPEAIA